MTVSVEAKADEPNPSRAGLEMVAPEPVASTKRIQPTPTPRRASSGWMALMAFIPIGVAGALGFVYLDGSEDDAADDATPRTRTTGLSDGPVASTHPSSDPHPPESAAVNLAEIDPPALSTVSPLARERAITLHPAGPPGGFAWGPLALTAAADDGIARLRANGALLEAVRVDEQALRTEVLVIDREDGRALARLENVADRSTGVEGDVVVLLMEHGGEITEESVRIRNVWRGTSFLYWTGRAPDWTRMRRRHEPAVVPDVGSAPDSLSDPLGETDPQPSASDPSAPTDREIPPVIMEELQRRLRVGGSQGQAPP